MDLIAINREKTTRQNVSESPGWINSPALEPVLLLIAAVCLGLFF